MPRKRQFKNAVVRAAVRREAVLKSGGQRVDLVLSSDGAEALQKLRAHWQCRSNTETVETALLAMANQV